MLLSLLLAGAFSGGSASAQQKPDAKGGVPPAKVVTAKIKNGVISPESAFIGTVFYPEVSEVASEVTGKVRTVLFNDGQKVKKGQTLVKLEDDLLLKSYQATFASYEAAKVDLERARRDLKRMEALYREDSIAEQLYDEHRFRVEGLEKKTESLDAEAGRLKLELDKKTVHAPFNGIVIRKAVDKGEWLSAGAAVATIARNDRVEVEVNVPQEVLAGLKNGTVVNVTVSGRQLKGKVTAIVPRGDIGTRTFPVKITIPSSNGLAEGMEARVSLPVGGKTKALIVPRDALTQAMGKPVVYVVVNGSAKMVPVEVVAFQGLNAGVKAAGLSEGMDVVTKGNERLRDGQPVAASQPK